MFSSSKAFSTFDDVSCADAPLVALKRHTSRKEHLITCMSHSLPETRATYVRISQTHELQTGGSIFTMLLFFHLPPLTRTLTNYSSYTRWDYDAPTEMG